MFRPFSLLIQTILYIVLVCLVPIHLIEWCYVSDTSISTLSVLLLRTAFLYVTKSVVFCHTFSISGMFLFLYNAFSLSDEFSTIFYDDVEYIVTTLFIR